MTDGALLTPSLLVAGPGPVRGMDLGRVRPVADAALAWADGLITYAGPASGLAEDRRADARPVDGAVVPGFVDCHTHLPFFGWRADEFEAKLGGRTYRDLHGGGGIHRSARLLAAASDEDVMAFCLPLAAEMLAHGTTAVELKTGYGLSVEAELRQARLAQRLATVIPQTATVTLLACHAIPEGRSADEWVEAVCLELIPAAAAEGLADAVDVFVEDIAFSADDLVRVAEAAAEHDLAVRCHADQLSPSGAAEAAVRVGARNADHLNHVGLEGIDALGGSTTAAVVVPVADLVTREALPPVSALLEAGATVTVATDFNPGTAPSLSMPQALSLACTLYRVSPAAALVAATTNAAHVLGLGEVLGSLQPGMRADFLVLDGADPAMVPYRPGHNPVRETWILGSRMDTERSPRPQL